MRRRHQPRLQGRNGEIYRRWAIYGWTQERIGEEYNLSQPAISRIISEVQASAPKVTVDEMRSKQVDFLEEVQARALEIADMAGAPIAVGQGGVPLIDPDTGDVVRDYSGRIKALDTAMRASEHIAKRLGLHAAEKVQHSGLVRYEIGGVSESDLT